MLKSSSFCSSVSSGSTDDLQQLDEDDDNIKIEAQGANNIVIKVKLISLSTHDQLSIVDKVDAVQANTQNRVDNDGSVQGLDAAESDPAEQESKGKESPAQNEQDASIKGEIGLCGAGIDGKDEGEGDGQSSSEDNISGGVERGEPGNKIAFTEGENTKKDIICWDCSGVLNAAEEGTHNDNGNGPADPEEGEGSGANVAA